MHVLTRSADARELALDLGAASAGPADGAPPEPLDAAVLFAPAGELVPVALRALDQGGTLAVAGIHLSDIPALNYADELFREKQLRSVTANTRADGEEFLRLAATAAHAADDRAPPARRGRPGAGRPRRGPDHRSRRARAVSRLPGLRHGSLGGLSTLTRRRWWCRGPRPFGPATRVERPAQAVGPATQAEAMGTSR